MSLRGNLDVVTGREIAGWAQDGDAPDRPVSLIVTVDGVVVARVLANRYRADLDAASIGTGRCSFEVRPSPPLSRLASHVIAVRREGDGAHLRGSPATLEAAQVFDDELRDSLAPIFAAGLDEADLRRRLVFLAEQEGNVRRLLAEERSGADDPGSASRKRAIVIDEGLPRTGHDAGSNAIMSQMRSLQRIGYDVTFVPADLGSRTDELEAVGIVCRTWPWYRSVEEALSRRHGRFDLAYLYRVTTASRYASLVRHHQPEARLVFSVADLHHLRLGRQADRERRSELHRRAAWTRRIELTTAAAADAVITHSSTEARLLRRDLPAGKVHLVPWAVPLRPVTVPFEERRGIAYIGAYGHPPNVDAARWLVEEVMPELARLDPTLPCLLVGSELPDSLRRIAVGPVEAVGRVADLAEVFGRVRLTVATLAYGAGIKGKVLDSLAAGVPCICTPAAAEGLDLPDLLLDQVARDAAGLAVKIHRLHEDRDLAARCTEAGLAYVARYVSEDSVDALLRTAISG